MFLIDTDVLSELRRPSKAHMGERFFAVPYLIHTRRTGFQRSFGPDVGALRLFTAYPILDAKAVNSLIVA